MPFDGTHQHDIEVIKRAVRQARAAGRLICDDPEKFQRTNFSMQIAVGSADERSIQKYVCAIGAWEEIMGKKWWELVPDPTDRAHLLTGYVRDLMSAHDQLFVARKAGRARAITRAERTFDTLLA